MGSLFSNATSIGGLATGNSTSLFSIVASALLLVFTMAFEDRLKAWIQGLTGNIGVKHLIARRPVWLAFQVVCALLLIWIAVVASNISILRPGNFVGYTEQSPFKFGRYIASISRAASPAGGYCPEVYVTGDIGNASENPMIVWYSNQPIRIVSQNPSATFNTAAAFSGLSLGRGGYTTIEPKSSVQVTFVGHMDPSLCKDFKEFDLQRLRLGRIYASTEINIQDTQTKKELSRQIGFRDLPIALGN